MSSKMNLQNLQSGFAEVNGARLYYETAGSGHALVLTHEGIGDSRMYDDQFGVFAERFRTIRYDMRGFGRSSVPNAPFSYAEDLYGLLRYLGVEHARVLGMSMGGGSSIELALLHPEMVDALVLAGSGVGGFSDPEDENDPRWAQFDRAYEEATAAHDVEKLADLAVEIWVVGTGRSADQVNATVRERVKAMAAHNESLGTDESLGKQLEPPALGRLGEIQAPTLVIVGDCDVAGIQKVADVLAKEIPGATKIVMHNTAHVPNMEQPERFNQYVLDFLTSL